MGAAEQASFPKTASLYIVQIQKFLEGKLHLCLTDATTSHL